MKSSAIRQVWKGGNDQLLITIPKNIGIDNKDFVRIMKTKVKL